MGSASCFLQTPISGHALALLALPFRPVTASPLLIQRLRHAGRTSLSTGIAGGLISPIRAILLAPLKGDFKLLAFQRFTLQVALLSVVGERFR